MEVLRAEIAPGGSIFYVMTGVHGTMYGRAEYTTIERPHRIVYTQAFCDANELPARHPLSPTWPEKMSTTVTFSAEGPEQTRVTVTWEPEGAVSRDELETFVQSKGGMTQGWTGSFEKLETHLTSTGSA